MAATRAATPPRPLWPRVLNPGTALGLLYVPVAAFVLLWLLARDAPQDLVTIFVAYFLVTFAVSFVLLRLLPYRGLKPTLLASPFVLASAFLLWWGGLGVAAAIVAAFAIPNRFR
jgi:hypothetical protein